MSIRSQQIYVERGLIDPTPDEAVELLAYVFDRTSGSTIGELVGNSRTLRSQGIKHSAFTQLKGRVMWHGSLDNTTGKFVLLPDGSWLVSTQPPGSTRASLTHHHTAELAGAFLRFELAGRKGLEAVRTMLGPVTVLPRGIDQWHEFEHSIHRSYLLRGA
jgi:hypothetical protein